MIGASQFRIVVAGTLLSSSMFSVQAQDVTSARAAEVARLTAQVNAQLAASIKKDHNLAVLQGILNEPGPLNNVPQAMRHGYIELDINAKLAFWHAEQLGWVAESSENKANYLKSIEQIKAGQKGG